MPGSFSRNSFRRPNAVVQLRKSMPLPSLFEDEADNVTSDDSSEPEEVTEDMRAAFLDELRSSSGGSSRASSRGSSRSNSGNAGPSPGSTPTPDLHAMLARALRGDPHAGMPEAEDDVLPQIAGLCEGLERATMIESSQEFERRYELGEELGRGSFSVVRCIRRRDDVHPTEGPLSDRPGAALAVKVARKPHWELKALRRMRDECRALAKLRHPQVVRLIEIYESPRTLFIVMERALGGELFDRVIACHSFSEPHALYVMQQLVSVLAFMHSHGVIHRDIKAENVLLVSPDGWDILVSDFGLVKIFSDHEPLPTDHAPAASGLQPLSAVHRANSQVGSSFYVAPEIVTMMHMPHATATSYGSEVDVWSAGVLLYMLLCGCPPWSSPPQLPQRQVARLYHGGASTPLVPQTPPTPYPTSLPGLPPAPPSAQVLPPDKSFRLLERAHTFPESHFGTVSREAKELIDAMLTLNPEQRPSARALLAYPCLLPEVAQTSTSARGGSLSSNLRDNMLHFKRSSSDISRTPSEVDLSSSLADTGAVEWAASPSKMPKLV